ncbi:hypothetical protein B0H11DRAFT_2253736 [Mycena galericulata]|nr:hypothetical protein B0H11DRAFT_2253736 [Mycena galericulata]
MYMDNNEITLLHGPPDVGSLQRAQDLADEKKRRKYMRRYPLVNPSTSDPPELHDARFQKVVSYFGQEAPILRDAFNATVNLFAQVKTDTAKNFEWKNEHGCLICHNNSPVPSIVLPCPCKHSIFHLKCIFKWHLTKTIENLLPCPTCKTPSKPINVSWVSPMSPAENRARADRKHHKIAALRKSDTRRKAAEQVRKADSKARRLLRLAASGTRSIANRD